MGCCIVPLIKLIVLLFVCTQPEVSYMDPTNLEFAEEPRNRTLSFGADHTVQYADLAESPKYTNI